MTPLPLFQPVFSTIRKLAPRFSPIRRCSASSERLNFLLKIMPKDSKPLRHIRQRMTGNQPAPDVAFLQIVGDGSPGSPKVAILITTGSRYLFNCGEGTQRIIHEHKLGLSRVENVFFTTKNWENIGGLPGLTLTIKDIGVPKLTLHGPDGLDNIYNMTKRFLLVQDMVLEHRALSEKSFKDHALTAQYVVITAENGSPRDVNNREPSSPASKKQRRSNSPTAKPNDLAVAYIVRIADKPGALLISKCIEFGVPPGPLLAKLKDGEDVVLHGNKIVKSADVRLPDSPGPVFVVVECPTEAHISSLVDNPVFAQHQSHASCDTDRAELVVHFTPAEILCQERYQNWMNEFGASTQHLLINNSNKNPCSIAINRLQTMLNMVDESVFPLLPEQRKQLVEKEEPDLSESAPVVVNHARPLSKFLLRPPNRFKYDQCFALDNQAYRDEALQNEGIEEAIATYKAKYPSQSRGDVFEEPDVTFLGTGSSIPSKVRNTSGILIRSSKDCSILFDCGEGSSGQLTRFFGPEQIDVELRHLKAVFLSHPHADHHLGLMQLLKDRRQSFLRADLPLEPLWTFTPEPMISYFNSFHSNFEQILNDIRILGCQEWVNKTVLPSVVREVQSDLEMTEIRIVPVLHCAFSYGISITSKSGWKTCYSGDTMPCESLVEAGMGSDLLIHEATMEEMMTDDALRKMHSTTSQAIEVGRKMKAKFTLLTHFSQRYAKIPLLGDELPTDVGIAFDNMRIRLSELPKLPGMIGAMKLLFSEAVEEMQSRSEKRVQRDRWERKSSAERKVLANDIAEIPKVAGSAM